LMSGASLTYPTGAAEVVGCGAAHPTASRYYGAAALPGIGVIFVEIRAIV
jgi:hypothetical protein